MCINRKVTSAVPAVPGEGVQYQERVCSTSSVAFAVQGEGVPHEEIKGVQYKEGCAV